MSGARLSSTAVNHLDLVKASGAAKRILPIDLLDVGCDSARLRRIRRRPKYCFFSGFWGILPFSKMSFPFYLSLRKGLTHRLCLLGIEKIAKRVRDSWSALKDDGRGAQKRKCFHRFGTNAALL